MRDHPKPTSYLENRGARLCLRAAVIGLAILLAGCAAAPPAPTPGPFGRNIPPGPRKVLPRPTAHPKDHPAAAAIEETAAPPEEHVEPQAEQTALAVPPSADLLGLDPQHTKELLGPAAQTDTRSPATVWHYKSERCELNLSFYMEMRSGQMRALHYDFKGEAASPEQQQACLRSIIEENRKSERS